MGGVLSVCCQLIILMLLFHFDPEDRCERGSIVAETRFPFRKQKMLFENFQNIFAFSVGFVFSKFVACGVNEEIFEKYRRNTDFGGFSNVSSFK